MQYRMHRQLVRGFFQNARQMLYLDGEIHVSHKIKSPFNKWKIENLAQLCSLVLVSCDDFKIEDYPGYQNKRGAGARCDEPFHLGKCITFKFQIALRRPVHVQQRPTMLAPQPLHPPFMYNNVHLPVGVSSHMNMSNECRRLFGGYLSNVEETFGNRDSIHDVRHSVHEALMHGFQAYMGASPVQPMSGYIRILEELHRLTFTRSQHLSAILTQLNQYRWESMRLEVCFVVAHVNSGGVLL